MSNLRNSDGHPTIIQVCEGKQPHKIDNNKENKLKIPGLFDRGGETGDLKVMHSNGETTTYYKFDTYLSNFLLEKDDYIKLNSYRFERLRGIPAVISESVRRCNSL